MRQKKKRESKYWLAWKRMAASGGWCKRVYAFEPTVDTLVWSLKTQNTGKRALNIKVTYGDEVLGDTQIPAQCYLHLHIHDGRMVHKGEKLEVTHWSGVIGDLLLEVRRFGYFYSFNMKNGTGEPFDASAPSFGAL